MKAALHWCEVVALSVSALVVWVATLTLALAPIF